MLPTLHGQTAKTRLDVEHAVTQRYSAAAKSAEAALCCSVQYDGQYLKVLPAEIIERDYGCGDPSRYVRQGETVLDLGSGGGKICYIASQLVGPHGRVIGIDMNEEMLGLARRYQAEIAQRIGWDNVTFHRGRIQDLALDWDRFDRELQHSPITSSRDWFAAQRLASRLRHESPMVASESVDVVLSNCVLNLVDPEGRRELFDELFRVIRPGGRAVISDIVSVRPVPEHLRSDPHLWSGCISGAFVEQEFLAEFARAGFSGIEIIQWQQAPWATVEGIEFRSVTVRAHKWPRPQHESIDANAATVVYRGPWKMVVDDCDRKFHRGARTPVTPDMLSALSSETFASQMIIVNSSGTSPDETSQPAGGNAAPCCGPTGCCD